MPTNPRSRQPQDLSVRAVIPRPVVERLGRIEDLCLEMRHELDLLLKMLARTQAQLDALSGEVAERGAPRESFRTGTTSADRSVLADEASRKARKKRQR
jgi:hypothetical protein